MFYIARNSLAVTGLMTKKRCLELWADHAHTVTDDAKYTVCKETGNPYDFVPVLELN